MTARNRLPKLTDFSSGVMAALIAVCLAFPVGADFTGHGGMIRGIALSPDGSRVMTASFDYTARLWDFGSQNELAALTGHAGPVNAVAFMPDGHHAVSVGDDGVLVSWDLRKNAPLHRFEGHTAKIADVSVSSDGHLVATASWDQTVRLWDLRRQSEVNRLAHDTPVNAVAFAPDHSIVYSGGNNGQIAAWAISDGSLLYTFPAHDMAVTDVAVSPDGTRLLSAGIDETVRVSDLATRRELHVFRGHAGPVFSVAFSPDGGKAVSAGLDGLVILWSLETGRSIRWIEAHDGPAWAVAFSRDGRFALSAGSDETLRLWHLDSGSRIGMPLSTDDDPKPWLDSSHPGAKLFRSCAACHDIDAEKQSRSGPHLEGLFGRRVGTVPSYAYSTALAEANFVWNHDTLTALFRDGPDVMVPGSKMPLQRIPNAEALDALVAYLEIITAKQPAETD